MAAAGRAAASAGCVLLLLALPLSPTAPAAPMQQGGDTRDVGSLPAFSFGEPVTVRPGEGGEVRFEVTNRYNQTIQSVLWEVAFEVGGDWLNARNLSEVADPPRFVLGSPLPQDLDAGERLAVEANFTTAARTPPGVYLVSIVLRFRYVNASGSLASAVVASLGSLDDASKRLVDMSDYNGTLDRLALDGIAPDTSIAVDSGEGSALFAEAVAFGVVVLAAGGAYGLLASRRASGKRRKAP